MPDLNDDARLRMIAEDMGLPFDELGHCYRFGGWYPGSDGESVPRICDFDPVASNEDAFRVMVAYGMSFEAVEYGVFVRNREGRMVIFKGWEDPRGFKDEEERLSVYRRAIFEGAACLCFGRLGAGAGKPVDPV